jgi:hypothetical protein
MNTGDLGNLGDLIAYLGIIVAASVAYSQAVGPYQVQLTETVIVTLQLSTRWKRLANLATGLAVALVAFGVAAYAIDQWALLLPGVFAGFLASVKAGETYDAAKAA